MSIVYLLKNQHNQYLDKSGEWVTGEISKSLYRTAHKDEAINQKVEFSVKNVDLRISIFETTYDENGNLHAPVEATEPNSSETGTSESIGIESGEIASGENDDLFNTPSEEEPPFQAAL